MALFIHKVLKFALTSYKANIIIHKKKYLNYYALHCGQKHSEQLFKYMYSNATVFMERKYRLFLKGIV